jgi:hypothetical protein
MMTKDVIQIVSSLPQLKMNDEVLELLEHVTWANNRRETLNEGANEGGDYILT